MVWCWITKIPSGTTNKTHFSEYPVHKDLMNQFLSGSPEVAQWPGTLPNTTAPAKSGEHGVSSITKKTIMIVTNK